MCKLSWTGLVHNRDTIWSWYPEMASRRRAVELDPVLGLEDFKQLLD
jgi:hypothetical protein